MRKRRKKEEIKNLLDVCLEEIVDYINEAVDLSFGDNKIKGRAALAMLLYDINRTSAQALALLRYFGLNIKMDIDFMAMYKDDPFNDKTDHHKHMDIKFVDYEVKDKDNV